MGKPRPPSLTHACNPCPSLCHPVPKYFMVVKASRNRTFYVLYRWYVNGPWALPVILHGRLSHRLWKEFLETPHGFQQRQPCKWRAQHSGTRAQLLSQALRKAIQQSAATVQHHIGQQLLLLLGLQPADTEEG